MDSVSSGQLRKMIRLAPANASARDRLLTLYRPYLRVIAEQSIGPALRRREDASDVVQRTLYEAAQGVEHFRGQSEPEFSAWIRQILRRNVANAVRDNRAARRDLRREQHPLAGKADSASISWQHAARQPSPSSRVMKGETALHLAAALETLPDDQRQAVTLRHLEGMSFAEIAAAMQKSHASVAGLLRRGVRGLRDKLRDESI